MVRLFINDMYVATKLKERINDATIIFKMITRINAYNTTPIMRSWRRFIEKPRRVFSVNFYLERNSLFFVAKGDSLFLKAYIQ